MTSQRTDWPVLIATSIVGATILALPVLGALVWNWSETAVSTTIEIGAALATVAGFVFLQRRILVQPRTPEFGGLSYGGTPQPQLAGRWIGLTFLLGTLLLLLALIVELLHLPPVWGSLAVEFGSAVLMLSILSVVESVAFNSFWDPDYKPKESGDLCYQADPPSAVSREWFIDGGVLTCGHEPPHVYYEQILDLDLVPDLSLRGIALDLIPEPIRRLLRHVRRLWRGQLE